MERAKEKLSNFCGEFRADMPSLYMAYSLGKAHLLPSRLTGSSPYPKGVTYVQKETSHLLDAQTLGHIFDSQIEPSAVPKMFYCHEIAT